MSTGNRDKYMAIPLSHAEKSEERSGDPAGYKYDMYKSTHKDDHHDVSTRAAFYAVREKQIVMARNRETIIPKHHQYIRTFMNQVNGWIVLVGMVGMGGSVWAYFKDLHLEAFAIDAHQLLFLQVLAILFGTMIFVHGQLGIYAFKTPVPSTKWITDLSLRGYFFVTLVSIFICLFCISVIYNTRIEMRDTLKLLNQTYADKYNPLIGMVGSTPKGLDGKPQLPIAPPYLYNEAIFAKYFNLIFFGAASHDFDDSTMNNACSDSVFITLWWYIRNACPEVLHQNSCAHCEEYSVVTCAAYEPTCTKYFEDTKEAAENPYDKNLACPYQICRSGMLESGLRRILWFQYIMEFIVGMQIIICIATITYAWEYKEFYRTQEEVDKCYLPSSQERGVYKKSSDFNDVMVRTNVLATVIYDNSDDEEEEVDEFGRYDHTYYGDSKATTPRSAAGSGTPGTPASRR